MHSVAKHRNERDKRMTDYLDKGPSAKSIFESKTFRANAVAILATLIGSRWPAVGDFVQTYGLELFGLLATANIGLRAVTKEPVVLKVSKKF